MKTFDEILEDFTPTDNHSEKNRPVTIWLPVEAKERYDRLQKVSHRQFAKKAKETLLALIEAAEQRTA